MINWSWGWELDEIQKCHLFRSLWTSWFLVLAKAEILRLRFITTKVEGLQDKDPWSVTVVFDIFRRLALWWRAIFSKFLNEKLRIFIKYSFLWLANFLKFPIIVDNELWITVLLFYLAVGIKGLDCLRFKSQEAVVVWWH